VLINRALAGQARRGPDLNALLNHPDATIGVTLGSSAETFAAIDYPQARLVKFEAWSDITRALETETLLAGFSDQIDAQKWQSEHPEAAISIETVMLAGPPDTIAVAVHFDDRQLRYWLDHFLAVKHRDGSLARLNHYYVGSDLWKKDLSASP
jgi:ABC-type amino acid transport substrate-binding protein